MNGKFRWTTRTFKRLGNVLAPEDFDVEKAMDYTEEKDSKIALQHIQNQAIVEFDHACSEEGIDP